MASVLARGMQGDLVEQLQRALMATQVPGPQGNLEPALGAVDGDFGAATMRAIQRVQKKFAVPISGSVDHDLWKRLTGQEWPDQLSRSLSLLASFEGHGYTKAAGDHDGCGITWGLIGFILIRPGKTLHYGSLHGLLQDIFQNHAAAAVSAFGADRAKRLQDALGLTPDKLHQFAAGLSTPSKLILTTDWQTSFAALGNDADVRQLQRDYAKRAYFDLAMLAAQDFASAFQIDSESTDQLFLDIQVNGGGLTDNEKTLAKARLTALIAKNPAATLSDRLNVITDVLVGSRRKKFSVDIRARKGTISNGFGTVHRKAYRLDGWGIETTLRAPKPVSLRHVILGFDPLQQREQLALAQGAALLGLQEPAQLLADAGLWPMDSGIAPITDGEVTSLSLRGLLGPRGRDGIEPEGDDLLHAVNLMFREPVGLLSVMGQATPLAAAVSGDQLVLGRQSRDYVGISLQSDDRLQLVRPRRSGEDVDDARLDITEIRPQLGSCRLMMLYCAFGIPLNGLPGCGRRWRDWAAGFAMKPAIVLGWFGNVRLPQDAAGSVVAKDFLARVGELETGADLATLADKYPQQIVQLWGESCHQAYAGGSQSYLWNAEGIAKLGISVSGAAAIAPDGTVWYANASFGVGAPGEAAMKQVTP